MQKINTNGILSSFKLVHSAFGCLRSSFVNVELFVSGVFSSVLVL